MEDRTSKKKSTLIHTEQENASNSMRMDFVVTALDANSLIIQTSKLLDYFI